MHVCLHVHTMHSCMYAALALVNTNILMHVGTCISIHMPTQMPACMSAHLMPTRMHIYTHVYTNVYVHVGGHVHTDAVPIFILVFFYSSLTLMRHRPLTCTHLSITYFEKERCLHACLQTYTPVHYIFRQGKMFA